MIHRVQSSEVLQVSYEKVSYLKIITKIAFYKILHCFIIKFPTVYLLELQKKKRRKLKIFKDILYLIRCKIKKSMHLVKIVVQYVYLVQLYLVNF